MRLKVEKDARMPPDADAAIASDLGVIHLYGLELWHSFP
jgi:hypothetical protein